MKKTVFRSANIILVFSLITLVSHGQISVKKVDGSGISSSAQGFYYSLPKTVLKINLVYEKVDYIPGPLSAYADEYLGVNDYIKSNRTEYNLIDADVSSFTESDNNQIYFVQFPAERAKDAKANTFQLSENGGLLSFNSDVDEITRTIETSNKNVFIFQEGDNNFPLIAQYNKRKQTDTVIRTISIDTMVINRFLFNTSWVDKTNDDRAKEAAMQIDKIRESRYNLISGYQEVNYGSSMKYMDGKLYEMEQQYMELFLGKTTKTIHSQTLYLTPDPNRVSSEILSFNDGSSVNYNISAKDQNISDSPSSAINNIFYRIPVNAEVNISSDNKNYFKGRFVVNQFGNIATVSLENTQLIFNPETGNLLKLVK